ncbi:MAG: hypothetical protein LC623_09715 [Halobacteriales archaeon]|nr:hypothetical protein [Halobacteriales archaeon]
MSPTPEEARLLLENLVAVGVLQRHQGPGGQECFCFMQAMAPSPLLEQMADDGLVERRTGAGGFPCYCLTAPLAPLRGPSGHERQAIFPLHLAARLRAVGEAVRVGFLLAPAGGWTGAVHAHIRTHAAPVPSMQPIGLQQRPMERWPRLRHNDNNGK